MALNIEEKPYNFTPRGQKLLFIVSSDNAGQPGFKYGVSIVETSTGKTYFYYYSPTFADSKLYFDLSPLVLLRNSESSNAIHSNVTAGTYVEPIGSAWEEYTVTFSEWWLIDGILSENTGVTASDVLKVFNAYYQISDGYRPNVETGNANVKFAMQNSTSYLWSDRKQTTYIWPLADSYNPLQPNAIYIPVWPTDYGLIYVTGTSDLSNNFARKYRINFYDGTGGLPIQNVLDLQGLEIEGIPIYPANLENNTDGLPIPSAYPNWTHYTLTMRNASNSLSNSYQYVFINAERFGLIDCRFDVIRLAWVSSRCGWDYFNFTKRSENSYNIERRQWRQPLPNQYLSSSRQQTDRQSVVNKIITVTSDWLQEGEFEFLKNLLISNQVQIVNEDGTQTPVNIQESSYVARRERTGRLFNLTLKISYSQDYWS
jgi:hypothetical protein